MIATRGATDGSIVGVIIVPKALCSGLRNWRRFVARAVVVEECEFVFGEDIGSRLSLEAGPELAYLILKKGGYSVIDDTTVTVPGNVESALKSEMGVTVHICVPTHACLRCRLTGWPDCGEWGQYGRMCSGAEEEGR